MVQFPNMMAGYDHSDILSGVKNPRLLKRGGQKAAYRAVVPLLGDAVIKVGTYQSANSLERAKREVATLQALASPYYPKQHEFRIASNNRFVVIEEYIDSTPLADCLGRFTQPTMTLQFVRELIVGLRLLWDQRIVHRDIKPDNVLVRPNGRPVIIDLGIARLLDADSLTLSHAARGPCTPVYAAPEQLKNRKAMIDARTDQFALGIVLVQLLSGGRHPFDPGAVGSGESIVANILAGKWHCPSAEQMGGAGVVECAKRLLGHEPHERYRSSDALLNEFNSLLGEAA